MTDVQPAKPTVSPETAPPVQPLEDADPAASAAVTQDAEPLIEITDLCVQFPVEEGIVRAVDGVSFTIPAGKTLGVVGESGCGKSVTARAIMRIVRSPGRIVEGKILYHQPEEQKDPRRSRLRRRAGGQSPEAQTAAPAQQAQTNVRRKTIDLTALDPRGDEIRGIRGDDIAMIFQEPMTSLSPVHTIGNQLMEAILLHRNVDKQEARAIAAEMLDLVGVPRANERLDDYPHQFSGGMRQRAMIAMALSCEPQLLIADEPTTALDVTTEAQILELIRDIQARTGMAVMLITHNLGVVAEMAQEVVVMYLGKVVERTDVVSLFYNPQHPYTQALLRSIPRIGTSVEELEIITGTVPDPMNIPKGCPYHTRCKEFLPGLCDVEVPILKDIEPGHAVSCLRREQGRSVEQHEERVHGVHA
ncbi:MAG: ABC transporter ATP-binding protein [Chloroflexota bacterium]|nr:ABC transporter ATP-binding protein [Chloroflexota bacterium]